MTTFSLNKFNIVAFLWLNLNIIHLIKLKKDHSLSHPSLEGRVFIWIDWKQDLLEKPTK